MSSGSSYASGGIGFGGALTLLFIGLKLGSVINWPWFSFNPFELSVFIVTVITIWIVVLFLVGLGAYALIKSLSK
jgi:hypothetical protein